MKMRKFRKITGVMLILCMAAGLTACGGNKDKNGALDALRDKLEDGKESVIPVEDGKEGQDDAGTVSKTEPETTDGGALAYLSDVWSVKKYDTEWRDNKDLVLDFDYEKIALGTKSRDMFPELDRSLMIANDLIVTDEANKYMANSKAIAAMSDAEIQEGIEEGTLPCEEHWNNFVRRADRKIFSFLSMDTAVSRIEYNNAHYVGYNYRTQTGEELQLSDVVADQDKFCEMVAEKTAKIIDQEMGVYYAEGEDPGEANAVRVKENLHTEARGNWTIDPQGVSVWFDSFTMMPGTLTVTVLYSEDTDGTVFKSEFRDDVPEDWAMGFPMYYDANFDAEDDGTADYVAVFDDHDYYDENDTIGYITGISVSCDGHYETVTNGDEIYNIRPTLVHRSGNTYLMLSYAEYDYYTLECFKIENGLMKKVGSADGGLFSDSDVETGDDETKECLLTDPLSFMLGTYTSTFSTCGSHRRYRISDGGAFEPVDPDYTIETDSRYTLTLKYALPDTEVLDEKTREVMSTKMDLAIGDKITMEYTDGENYVDCRTEDGTLVRIRIYDSPDGRSVKSDNGDVSIYDAFDGAFFAG